MAMLFINSSVLGYYPDVIDTDYERPVGVLSSMGIIEGYDDGSFQPEKEVTRAEFAAIIIRFLDMDDIVIDSYTYYNDVGSEHWALSAINQATGMGLIEGDGEGYFRPDDAVIATEALKVIIKALGYTISAEARGGYPDGYRNEAVRLGITKNFNGTYDEALSRGDTALFLYNSLEVGLAEEENNGITTTDKTILGSVHNIEKREGRITSTKYAEIVPMRKMSDTEIAVESVIYKISDEFLHELVGYEIEFYAKVQDDEDIILYYEVKNEGGETVIVWADYLVSQDTEGYFKYVDDSGRTRRLKLSNAGYVVKNGKPVAFTGSDIFDIDEGNILLIDSDGNNEYETIFINASQTVIVDRTNTQDQIVYCRYLAEPSISFSDNLYSDGVHIFKDGATVGFDSIKAGNVLTIYKTDDNSRITAHISENTASGTITRTDADGLWIGEEKYMLTQSYKNLIEEGSSRAIVPEAGAEVTLYLDINGDVAGIETISGGGSEQYALLIKGYNEDDGSFKLVMYPYGGSVKTYDAAEPLQVEMNNETGKYSSQNIFDKLAQTKVFDMENVTDCLCQIVKFNLNSNGEVSKLKVAYSNGTNTALKDANIFSLDYSSEAVSFLGTDIVEGKYKVPSDSACIFYVPDDPRDYSKYSNQPVYLEDTNYKLALYDINSHNYAQAAIIFKPTEYGSDIKYNTLFTVSNISEAVNDEGDIVYRVTGITDRTEKYYDFDYDPQMNRGDVYQFGVLNDKVQSSKKIFDGKNNEYVYAVPQGNGYGMSGAITNEVCIAYLQVLDISTSTVVLTDGTNEYMLNTGGSTRYTIVESGINDMKNARNAASSDLNVGDNVVVRTWELIAGDLVIMR